MSLLSRTLTISNPLILQTIFANIDIEEISLKELRFVCKQWNDVIVTLPQPRIRLILNNTKFPNITSPQTFVDFSNSMNEKLARSIRLLNREELRANRPNLALPDHRHGWGLEAVGYMNLTHCIQQFSSQIRIIDLFQTDIQIDFIKVLHQLLQEYCPNLMEIRLFVNSIPEELNGRNRPPIVSSTWRNANFSILESNGGRIPIKKKLKIIKVYMDERQTNPPRIATGPLQDLYCSLVKAAPNLVELWQKMIAFPDCSGAKYIKALDFHLQLFYYDFNSATGTLTVNFNLQGLARMIQEVSSSVKYLNLQVDHTHCRRLSRRRFCSCAEQMGFVMPRLMKLQIFHCSDTNMFFKNPETIRNLNSSGQQDHLQHISIGRHIGIFRPGIGQFISDICQIAFQTPISNNLTSITINGISSLESLVKLKLAFPSLKTVGINKAFGMRQHQADDFGDSVTSCLFAQALDIADILNLQHLDFTLPLPNSFSTFVEIMDYNASFFRSGCLKTLIIVGTGCGMNMAPAEEEATMLDLKLALYAMKKMKTVQIIKSAMRFEASTGQKFYNFISANHLPIQFEDNE